MTLTREMKVGALAIVAVVLLLVGLSYLQGRSVLERTFTLVAEYDHVQGLVEGNDVQVNGYKVGTVKTMGIDGKTGKIRVTFELQSDLKVPIDSRALISADGLIGGMKVELLRGRAPSFLASGDTLADSLQIALIDRLSTEVAPVKAKIEALLDELTAVSRSVRVALADTVALKRMVAQAELSTRHLASITHQVDGTLTHVDTIARNLSAVTGTIRQNDRAIGRILTSTATVSDSLAASMHDVRLALSQTRSTLESIDSVMKKVRNGQGNIGRLVHDEQLYTNLTKSAESLDKLLIDLRQKPGKFLTVAIFGRKD